MQTTDIFTFRPMRRRRQELSREATEEILRRGTYGVLSVIGDGGYPYGVPVNYVYIDNCIYLHTAKAGHKVDALRREPRVSFTVVDASDVVPEEYTTYFRSAIAFGCARFVSDEDERLRALSALGDRFHPDHPDALAQEIAKSGAHLYMVAIEVEHLSGKEAIELVRR